ncbi:hypothetical protein [Bifidobacterium sp. ESL0704]|nr:hypothetical protein [Bifidobacterium sp. ESL0704]WEV53262.1 hypothetical protein OZX64_01855 [Bifidobacterium sp. ESL0704]
MIGNDADYGWYVRTGTRSNVRIVAGRRLVGVRDAVDAMKITEMGPKC